MHILLLILLLSVELFAAYFLFDEDIIAPAVVFPGIFLFSALDLLSMYGVWKTDIHLNTVFVVAGGCLVFLFAGLLAKRRTDFRAPRFLSNPSASREIRESVQIIFAALNLMILVVVGRKITEVVAAAGFSRSTLDAFGTYSYMTKFSEYDTNIGKLASNLYQFAQMETYFWGFELVDQWFEKKKPPVWILLNYLITTLSYFLAGSRTGAIFAVFSLLPIFVLKYRKKTGKKHLKTKYLLYLGLLAGMLLLSFQWMGEVIGRRLAGTGLWEYISIYTGAPILNLDLFLQEPHPASVFWGYNTFGTQIAYLRRKVGLSSYHIDIPFRSVHGHNLGNVYTTFYAYLYDFGVVGMIVLVAIMAVVMQKLYTKTKDDLERNSGISLAVMAFMCLYPCIVFAFFSNKFYEQINIAFLKGLLYWMILPRVLFTRRKPGKKPVRNESAPAQGRPTEHASNATEQISMQGGAIGR